jgi:hypothetical protein
MGVEVQELRTPDKPNKAILNFVTCKLWPLCEFLDIWNVGIQFIQQVHFDSFALSMHFDHVQHGLFSLSIIMILLRTGFNSFGSFDCRHQFFFTDIFRNLSSLPRLFESGNSRTCCSLMVAHHDRLFFCYRGIHPASR